MLREIAISLYLFIFQILFTLFKLFPQQEKTTFVASFGDNSLFVMEELEEQTKDKVVVLKTAQCKVNFKSPDRVVLLFEPTHFLQWLRSIYHLATSHKVIVDNYYGFLAATNFKSGTECIQLWHAAGAVKQFGLKDSSISQRSARALKRFKRVYRRFDRVAVGSENMAAIFQESFGLSDEKIVRTGVPRTDYFFDDEKVAEVEQQFIRELPMIKNKRVILYAPTYREDEFTLSNIELDLKRMYAEFKFNYVLFLRLHPAVNGAFQNKYPGFVFNMSSYSDINHLLTISDLLVTDYSSIPFEFSLLNKPMIFFAYDLEQYANKRGFWEDYENLLPGPVVKTTEELVRVIKANEFNLKQVEMFANEWNEYSTGTSSKDLVQTLYFDNQMQQTDK